MCYYSSGCYSEEMLMNVIHFDDYVIDVLLRDLVGHDHQPSAFLVYLYLWRMTWGSGGQGGCQISLRDLSEATGLSKRAVQNGIAWLKLRQLIEVAKQSITAVAEYKVLRPWQRGLRI